MQHGALQQTVSALESSMRALEGYVEMQQEQARAAQRKIRQLEKDLVDKEDQLAQVDECERAIMRLKSVIAEMQTQPPGPQRASVETQSTSVQVNHRQMKESSAQCMPLTSQTRNAGVQLEEIAVMDRATQMEGLGIKAQDIGVQAESRTHRPSEDDEEEDTSPEEGGGFSSELASLRKQLALSNQRLQVLEEFEDKYKVMHQRAQAAERCALEVGLWKRRALETQQQVFMSSQCCVSPKRVALMHWEAACPNPPTTTMLPILEVCDVKVWSQS